MVRLKSIANIINGKMRNNMAIIKKIEQAMSATNIMPEMDLKNIIYETREVAQAMLDFAKDLERIQEKYTDLQAKLYQERST